jgi:hypothetical protein
MKKVIIFSGFLFIFLLSLSIIEAATVYNFQGKLTDKAGKAVTTKIKVTFRIYKTLTGGTSLWTEQKEVTPDSQGRMGAKLGETSSLNLAPGKYYVEVQIGNETMTPRHLTDFALPPSPAISKISVDVRSGISRGEFNYLTVELARRKFTKYLHDYPNISRSLKWHDVSTSTILAYDHWTSQMKEDLLNFFVIYETGAPYPYATPPIPQPPYRGDITLLTTEDRWNMYLANVAFSLYLDANSSFPAWNLGGVREENLDLILSSDEILTSGSGNFFNITAWNPKYCYDFLSSRGMIKRSQEETIYELTNWCRKYLWHWTGRRSELMAYYGYNGAPLIDQVLTPRWDDYTGVWETKVYGCWGATALFKAVLRSVNIPVKEHFRFRQEGGTHSGCEFPGAHLGVIHSDDLYVRRLGLYYIPNSLIFLPLSELISTYPDPPASPDLSDQNHQRWRWVNLYNHPDDLYISWRCWALDTSIGGISSATLFQGVLDRSSLTEEEKTDWTRRIDEIIEREGGPRSFVDRSAESRRTRYSTPP